MQIVFFIFVTSSASHRKPITGVDCSITREHERQRRAFITEL